MDPEAKSALPSRQALPMEFPVHVVSVESENSKVLTPVNTLSAEKQRKKTSTLRIYRCMYMLKCMNNIS